MVYLQRKGTKASIVLLVTFVTVASSLFPAVSACDDVPPDFKHTCEQQKAWGKCDQPWMKDKCKKSCGRCPGVPAPTKAAVPNSATPVNIRTTPVNPKATDEAKKLYTALLQQYGKKILSGQQFDKTELDYVREHSGGKEPAIGGYDLMNILYFEPREKQQAYMQGVIDWSKKKGGVVTFCWHWRNPLGTANQWKTLEFMVKGKDGNADVHVDLNQLSNKNSKEYKAIIRDIDHVAKYLKQLQAAKVPVLFRPLHEAQGKWFWWGEQGPKETKQLYRLLFDRLVRRHRLNNLLWVWTTEANPSALAWYPGDERVDILGMDIYPENNGKDPHDIEAFPYKAVNELFKGKKMIALTENGAIPDPAKLVSRGDHWSWFCTWAGEKLTNETLNTKVSIKSTFNHEYVLTLGQFKV